jgi:hypothetical protein
MLLAISLIVNFISFAIIHSLNKEGGNKVKVIYKDKILYKDRIIYKDKILYKDRVIYKDKIVKQIVYKEKSVPSKSVKEKKVIKKEEPQFDPSFSTKKIEILKELLSLESKKKKTKQDVDTIYTLKMVLPNIK